MSNFYGLSKNRSIILGLFVVVICIVFVAYFLPKESNDAQSQQYVVELRESGFYPLETKIKRGDSVLFRTILSVPFWPASDLHPTHGIYPEFDPEQSISSGNTWSFKFNKVGKWRFHDHLHADYVGTVIVE